jgi:hypothetical protein
MTTTPDAEDNDRNIGERAVARAVELADYLQRVLNEARDFRHTSWSREVQCGTFDSDFDDLYSAENIRYTQEVARRTAEQAISSLLPSLPSI